MSNILSHPTYKRYFGQQKLIYNLNFKPSTSTFVDSNVSYK